VTQPQALVDLVRGSVSTTVASGVEGSQGRFAALAVGVAAVSRGGGDL
jgi:hypothetical protein